MAMSALNLPGESLLRWLRVVHETRYHYGAAVELAHHMAHLRPRNMPNQLVREVQLSVSPAPDNEALWDSLDPYGNTRTLFSHSQVHDQLLVRASFLAGMAEPAPLEPQASPAWESVAERLRYHAGEPFEAAEEFVLPSSYAPHEAALAEFAALDFTAERPLLDAALAMMHRIYTEFDYRPTATSVATRATEALAKRAGVCQDFAHVMIGALRSIGLAARYVSGYLLTHPPEGQLRLVGADASHAWAAVWCPHHGWVALDPTNDVLVGVDHVTLAWGRDYGDVAPLRGVIRGGARAVPEVAVTVEEWPPQGDAQPQTPGD
jgi:transglutaminase-like putative cysteine protease